MRSTHFFTWFVVALAPSLAAQERSLGTRIAALTAPLGDADAVAIAYVDPGKIDLAAAVDWVATTMKSSDHDRAQLDAALKEPRQMQIVALQNGVAAPEGRSKGEQRDVVTLRPHRRVAQVEHAAADVADVPDPADVLRRVHEREPLLVRGRRFQLDEAPPRLRQQAELQHHRFERVG